MKCTTLLVCAASVATLGCGDDDSDSGVPFDAAVMDGGGDRVDAFEPSDAAMTDAGVDLGPPPDLGPLPGSCAGSCGQTSPGRCRCDDACVVAGACCDDYEDAGCPLEAELRGELAFGQVRRSYDGARDLMYGITGSVDVVGGMVECVYTGTVVTADGTRTPGGSFNTEHVWPRSAGEPSGSAGDLYNLRPTLQDANSQRASFPFGETVCDGADCPWNLGGSELGSDGSAQVFQVRPQTQGDIARSMFYFAIRYTVDIPANEEAALRAWHAADPPDAAELGRVDAVEAAQGNRNAFVDRPEVVDVIDDF